MPEVFAEGGGEMGRRLEPHLIGNLRYGACFGGQQLRGPFQAEPADEVRGRLAQSLFRATCKLAAAQAHDIGQVRYAERAITEVLVNDRQKVSCKPFLLRRHRHVRWFDDERRAVLLAQVLPLREQVGHFRPKCWAMKRLGDVVISTRFEARYH